LAFISTLDNAQREMSNSGKPEPGDDYLLKVDNPLVVPVGKKIRIITTANDVIHAFAVHFIWHQTRCHSWFCARHMVPCRENG
jgi:heme/copper-type cytochrome/quinol oxidase subunit 2